MFRPLAALLLAACAPQPATPPPTMPPPSRPTHSEPAQGELTPAAVLATPAAAEPGPSRSAARKARRGTEKEIAYCVEETNRYRAAIKKPPFARSPRLDAFAASGAELDARQRKPHHHFNHTAYPEPFSAFAENEIPWWGLPDDGDVRKVIKAGLASMWAEGPGGGHYENLVGGYTEMGCGIWVERGQVTIVQNFRKP